MKPNEIILEDIQTILNSDVCWSKFTNSTILITGANGFLPAYMVETLLCLNQKQIGSNIRIIALVRNKKRAIERLGTYLNQTNLIFLEQDVSDPILISEKIDYIIHAASQASPKFYGTDPVGTLKANVLGTINLMELARLNSIKSFLYFSSGEVYGEVYPNKIPISEDTFGYVDPTKVRSCYAESKRMGENICVSYCNQYNIPVKIVRPFHTYGPGMKLDDGRVYADFVSNILKGENIKMLSSGSAIRAFCYLTDATIGFFKVLLEGENGEAYNVGNPNEEYSIFELARTLTEIYPEKGLKVEIQERLDSKKYLTSNLSKNSPSIKKIGILNWIPKVTIKEGFSRTIKSYQ